MLIQNIQRLSGWQVWKAILLYTALKVLQGGTGLLQSIQSYLWFPINQYTTREISLEMFGHLHNLSLQFHISRKTGEVLRVMDRGTSSIVQLLSQILLSIFPTLLDIGVAVVFFAIRFNFSFGLIVFTTMAVYIYVTIAITEWRTKFRRAMIEADNDVRTKAVDSLLNFETVKYYGAEDFELNRYSEAVAKYQKADWKTLSSLTLLNLTQSIVITLGLLAGNLLCAYEVTRGNMSLKEFITFNTYIMQLYTPVCIMYIVYPVFICLLT
jgi:ATP-binding cassette subfamily B (MDR/TAP) protein 6